MEMKTQGKSTRNAGVAYFGLNLPKELLAWLQEKSDRECESISTVIRDLIRKAKEEESKPKAN